MDDMLLGVQVAGRTLKLSQFADDTQFLLRNFDQLARMWAAHRSLRASDRDSNERREIRMRMRDYKEQDRGGGPPCVQRPLDKTGQGLSFQGTTINSFERSEYRLITERGPE